MADLKKRYTAPCDSDTTRAGVYAIVSLFASMSFLLVALFYALPSNLISSRSEPSAARSFFVENVPESWAYFTKDPQGEELVPYAVTNDGEIENISTTPQNKTSNLLGLSRNQRAQGPEMALVRNTVPRDGWSECSGSDEYCFGNYDGTFHRVLNSAISPTICGNIILAVMKPTPWAYRDLVDYTNVVTSFAPLDVDCDHR